MKIAHFCIFAPYGNGQYGSVRDLIKAEKLVGIDAGFIDCGHGGKAIVREGLKDDGLETLPLEWAMDADLIIRHSAIPKEIDDLGTPVITALHGRPEGSFLLEYYGKGAIINEINKVKNKQNHAGFLNFWEEHLFHWSQMLGGKEILYIPAPIDISRHGLNEKYEFKGKSGSPNIIIADRWREDITPYNLLMAVAYFKEYFNKDAKVHVYGIPGNVPKSFLKSFNDLGILGEALPPVKRIAQIFGSADILLTSFIMATRVVREAMANNLRFVAGEGCRYTKYSADPRNTKLYAEEINRCLNDDLVGDLRSAVDNEHGLEVVGIKAKEVFEKALSTYREKKTLGSLKNGQVALTKVQFAQAGRMYCNSLSKGEHGTLRTKRRNERAIEYQFVFKHLAANYPSTILDVGSGMSSLSHLMSLSGFEVDAVDNTDKSCWPDGFFNRHFIVEHDDITDTKISKHYDFITCISVLEHVPEHDKAVKNMLGLLNPGGKLLITCPYNEDEYVENVYKLEGAGYGQNFPYICQIFSSDNVKEWFEGTGCFIGDQEYWKVFHGKFWTFGRQFYPPVKTSKDELHQLTCLLLEKE